MATHFLARRTAATVATASSATVAAASTFSPSTTSGSCPSINCSITFPSSWQVQTNPDISGIGVRPRSLFWMPCAGFFADNNGYNFRSFWDSQSRPTLRSSSALRTTSSTSKELQILLIAYFLRQSLQNLLEKYPRNGVRLFRALCFHSVTHKPLREFLFS